MVNGHGPYRFLVDTGANVDLIESDLATSIGLELDTTGMNSHQPAVRPEYLEVPGMKSIGFRSGRRVSCSYSPIFRLFIISRHRSEGCWGNLFYRPLTMFSTCATNGSSLENETGKELACSSRWSTRGRTIETNLGWLVLDSGTRSVVLFGVTASDVTQSVRTLSGSVETGTVSTKLMIGGTVFWRGEATAAPRQTKETEDGLLPIRLFKTVYVCNSEGFIVVN